MNYNPSQEEINFVNHALEEFNTTAVGPDNHELLNIVEYDSKGNVIAGILGGTYWGWMHLDILWVDEKYRKSGIGSRLLKAAEEEAAQKAAEEAARAEEEEASQSGKTYLGTFKITAYCHCAKCNGRAGQPTASGAWPYSGHTVAMGGVPFGTKLLINGTVYTVEDRGTPYGHVDIFMDSHEEALDWGLHYLDVYQVN